MAGGTRDRPAEGGRKVPAADVSRARMRSRGGRALVVIAALVLSTQLSSADETSADADSALASARASADGAEFLASVAPSSIPFQPSARPRETEPGPSPRIPRFPEVGEVPIWAQGGRTFAAEFSTGLGSFAHDEQWGCGFGVQSDFMGDLRQVTVGEGVAVIRAERARTPCGREYASAIMSTRGRFSQLYGYFEARIRFDAGTGLWPAFWMQPADGSWPPEIDIMEAYPNSNGAGPGPNRYMSSLHLGPGDQVIHRTTNVGSAVGARWHTYGVDWRPQAVTFTFDGRQVAQITDHVPDKAMYLLLDLAVGNWSAMADETTPDQGVMEIDWVRAYR